MASARTSAISASGGLALAMRGSSARSTGRHCRAPSSVSQSCRPRRAARMSRCRGGGWPSATRQAPQAKSTPWQSARPIVPGKRALTSIRRGRPSPRARTHSTSANPRQPIASSSTWPRAQQVVVERALPDQRDAAPPATAVELQDRAALLDHAVHVAHAEAALGVEQVEERELVLRRIVDEFLDQGTREAAIDRRPRGPQPGRVADQPDPVGAGGGARLDDYRIAKGPCPNGIVRVRRRDRHRRGQRVHGARPARHRPSLVERPTHRGRRRHRQRRPLLQGLGLKGERLQPPVAQGQDDLDRLALEPAEQERNQPLALRGGDAQHALTMADHGCRTARDLGHAEDDPGTVPGQRARHREDAVRRRSQRQHAHQLSPPGEPPAARSSCRRRGAQADQAPAGRFPAVALPSRPPQER